MIADKLIRQCHDAGVELSVNGDWLYYEGNEAFFNSIEKELRDNKPAIIQTLIEDDLIQCINNPDVGINIIPSLGQRIDFYMSPCELLPDDKDFLILRLPVEIETCRAILQAYKYQWLTGMEKEPVEHKKQNKGRYSANTWLRVAAGFLIDNILLTPQPGTQCH